MTNKESIEDLAFKIQSEGIDYYFIEYGPKDPSDVEWNGDTESEAAYTAVYHLFESFRDAFRGLDDMLDRYGE